jgi:hypothetical protein
MVIKIKDITFADWRANDPSFMWCREVIHSDEKSYEDGVGIVLMCFDQLWSVRFFNSHFFHLVKEAYKLMYPSGKSYLTAEEAKEDIDKFLHRVNSLKVFL